MVAQRTGLVTGATGYVGGPDPVGSYFTEKVIISVSRAD
ncbi:hypothetical protein CAFEA_03725 [Corynebacterium afermentans subsp. afermentans]|uniref:Uncharacterized protein n=1 Tax=Corynebacterium afermentans TaxID=38286 RepID=A0A9X8R3N1_9CORY|nr:hypothetical protein CAFEA_03725 [Corynebacterium afermentans subsp. afermentans]SIQ24919.1 hypothetical protein SAMN05421802_10953 [Corynebacterium afermentans]